MADELISIKQYSLVHEADADKGYLESHGVTCHLKGDHTANTALAATGLGSVELQVRQEDVEKAVELLKKVQ